MVHTVYLKIVIQSYTWKREQEYILSEASRPSRMELKPKRKRTGALRDPRKEEKGTKKRPEWGMGREGKGTRVKRERKKGGEREKQASFLIHAISYTI